MLDRLPQAQTLVVLPHRLEDARLDPPQWEGKGIAGVKDSAGVDVGQGTGRLAAAVPRSLPVTRADSAFGEQGPEGLMMDPQLEIGKALQKRLQEIGEFHKIPP